MTWDEFEAAREEQLQGPLLALWLDRQDEWERAHAVAQEVEGPNGAWVHAYLHRKEGDEANARYWYRRAGQPVAHGDLLHEADAIIREFLQS